MAKKTPVRRKSSKGDMWVATRGEIVPSEGYGYEIIGLFLEKADAEKAALKEKPEAGTKWTKHGEDRWKAGPDFVEIAEYPVQ